MPAAARRVRTSSSALCRRLRRSAPRCADGLRGRRASPARLVRLTCQRKHRCMMSCCGSWYGSQGLLLACRLPAARVSAAGAQHATPASLHDLQGSRKVRAPALGGLCARQNKRNASEEHGDIFEEQTSSPRAFDWYLDRLLTPTGRLNQHILADHLPLTLTLASQLSRLYFPRERLSARRPKPRPTAQTHLYTHARALSH